MSKTKKGEAKEPIELRTEKSTDGYERVMSSAGVEYWPPTGAKGGETVEGVYMETMEFKNTGQFAKEKPFQYRPILKTENGKQVALPDNFRIKAVIEKYGVQLYRVTFDGQTKGKGDHKGKKFNNYTVEFKPAPKGWGAKKK